MKKFVIGASLEIITAGVKKFSFVLPETKENKYTIHILPIQNTQDNENDSYYLSMVVADREVNQTQKFFNDPLPMYAISNNFYANSNNPNKNIRSILHRCIKASKSEIIAKANEEVKGTIFFPSKSIHATTLQIIIETE